jgi:hypothetical protein
MRGWHSLPTKKISKNVSSYTFTIIKWRSYNFDIVQLLFSNKIFKNWLICRAHHTCKKQGDLTTPSETMREKWRHDRETSNSVIETCFRKNMGFFTFFFILHLKCLLISFIFNNKFMFCILFYYYYWSYICWF